MIRSQPIRALFYLYFPGAGSGVGRYTHKLLEAFSCIDDVEVELACCPSFFASEQATYPVRPILREIYHERRWRRRSRFLIGQIANPLRAVRYAKRNGFDILHFCNVSNHVTIPLWLPRLKGAGLKIAVTAHDVFRLRGLFGFVPQTAYDNHQLSRVYRDADAVFVHGRQQKNLVADRCRISRDRTHIVPMGQFEFGAQSISARDARRKLKLPMNKQVALFFGTVRDDKRLDLLLESHSALQDRLHLFVAGRFAERQAFTFSDATALVERLGTRSDVTFTNRFLEEAEVPEAFAACDWLALPYGSDFTSQSGVLNAAVAYRKPILGTRTGAIGDDLERFDLGQAVAPDSAEELRCGMEYLSKRIEAKESFEFDRYLSESSWQKNAEITSNVYRQIIHGRTEFV